MTRIAQTTSSISRMLQNKGNGKIGLRETAQTHRDNMKVATGWATVPADHRPEPITPSHLPAPRYHSQALLAFPAAETPVWPYKKSRITRRD